MIKLLKYLIFLIAFTSISFSPIAQSDENINFSFGQEIDSAKISNQDITINALGTNLPEGNGTALKGEKIFLDKCVSCHLENEAFNVEVILD